LVGAGVVALRRNKINAPDTATRVTLLEHPYRIPQSYERMLADAPREQDQFAGPVSGIAVSQPLSDRTCPSDSQDNESTRGSLLSKTVNWAVSRPHSCATHNERFEDEIASQYPVIGRPALEH
jgi:hypothetical protein